MIYIKVKGRLGNQLFYYAIARTIQKINGYDDEIVFIPENKTDYDAFGGLTITDFKLSKYSISNKIELSIIQKIVYFCFQISKRILKLFGDNKEIWIIKKYQKILNKIGIYSVSSSIDCDVDFSSVNRKKYKNLMISGAWENPRYFSSVRNDLINEILPLNKVLEHNKELFNIINKNESICLSVRKGDFLAKGNEKFNVCSNEFYDNSVKYLQNKLNNPVMIIFSDDIEWCKQNLNYNGIKVYFENNNGEDPVWEKLRLMSSCKHFIIANSSFSWWAQYLSTNNEKIVCAPRPWRKNEYCDCLYDDNFVLLNPFTGELEETK